jgi:hypothetical protein
VAPPGNRGGATEPPPELEERSDVHDEEQSPER